MNHFLSSQITAGERRLTMELLNQKEVHEYAFWRACGFSKDFAYRKVEQTREVIYVI
jgi:hypothetical protein